MKQLQLIVSLSLLSLTLCEAWNDTVPDWERNGYDAVLANLLINQTTLTKITLIEYIEMMSTLRNIQQDKLQLPNRPEPDIATLISESITSEPDQLPYLFQGDIILTRDQMKAVIEFAHEDLANSTSTRRKRGGLTSELSLRWTKFPILYTINTGSGVDANAVQAGINLWQKLTCISFQRLRSGSGDFIEFFKGTGCYSNIGSVGGRQTISIGRGCNSPAIVAHEIGHSLGFWHEQSRFDRDNYIKVLSQNIKDGMEGQFGMEGQRDFQANGYPYDLGSVMHYGRTAFSSDDGDTIETIDKNYMGTIGQRVALSFYDVKNINTAYCNNRCSTKLPCQHNGYTDPKNCNVCRCSEPFGGTLCEKAASTSSSCGTIDLTAKPQYQTISMSGTGNCNWVITAIPNRKIFIQMDKFGFDEQNTCEYDYIEIRYGPDIANTGARMCSSPPRGPIRSSTNKAVIMFRGQGGRFSLRFRQGTFSAVQKIHQMSWRRSHNPPGQQKLLCQQPRNLRQKLAAGALGPAGRIVRKHVARAAANTATVLVQAVGQTITVRDN
uniref:Metalloendopeptidase n=1 Tax=Plectus sambesii TaxID=2011161 RepID=A0A914WQI5_9BILA